MIVSMTGYGRSESVFAGTNILVEIRSVNNRYLEITTRLSKTLARREADIKELIRSKLNRGAVNISIKVDRSGAASPQLELDTDAAKAYYRLLGQLKKALKLREKVKLEHILMFSELFNGPSEEDASEEEWAVIKKAVFSALDDLNSMRRQEGGELAKDLKTRVEAMGKTVEEIAVISKERIPEERRKLQERIEQMIENKAAVDPARLELEIVLLVDKTDVTEECVRFRSHTKFFLEAMGSPDPAGRRLNFLLQEMHREVNTIGSKSSDASIAHMVVILKEEIEKIREQIQNVE